MFADTNWYLEDIMKIPKVLNALNTLFTGKLLLFYIKPNPKMPENSPGNWHSDKSPSTDPHLHTIEKIQLINQGRRENSPELIFRHSQHPGKQETAPDKQSRGKKPRP